MPLLDSTSLAELRRCQAESAQKDERCPDCTAQTWPNYCRECDESFNDGHYGACARSSHQGHRTY